jgi:hypothetical protein
MSKRVYGWEDNPAIDQFRFKLSNERAEALFESGQVCYITLSDGREALQYLRPEDDGVPVAGNFLTVWRMKPSGWCCPRLKVDIPAVPVWQMNRQPELEVIA